MRLERYWRRRRVLISGASSGIGAALVDALAMYDVHFCLLSRRQAPMDELAAKHADSGSKFWIRSCDVRNRAEVEKAIAEFVEVAEGLDVAWINSGVAAETSFRHWKWDQVEQIIDTNLKGALYTAQTCLQYMVPEKKGAIVAISSVSAMRGLPARAIYSISKIGLAYYMDSMAAELRDIQFTTIYPGFVDTPINRNNPNRLWVMTAEKAAKLMLKAVARGKVQYIYPVRMNILFHVIRSLPPRMFRFLAHRLMFLSRPQR